MSFKSNRSAQRPEIAYDDGWLRPVPAFNGVGERLSTYDRPSDSDPDRPWRLCEERDCQFGEGHYHPAPLADLLIPCEGVE